MSWFDDNSVDKAGNAVTAQSAPTLGGGGVTFNTNQTVYDQNGQPVGSGQPVSGTYAGGQQQTATGGGTGQFQPYSDQAFMEILHRYPPTYEGVQAAADEAGRIFGPNAPQLLEHPTKHDKFRFPNGQVADVVNSAGGANASWTDRISYESGGGGGAAGALGGMLGSGNVGADPSFAFRIAEGQKALERSASAKGTLMTGGTLKALERYAQDYASTEYGNIFNRLYQTAGLGLNAAGQAANTGSGYSSQVGANNRAFAGANSDIITDQGAVQAAGDVNASNAWAGTIGDVANIGGRALTDWATRRRGRQAMDEIPSPMAGASDYEPLYPNSPRRNG